MAKHPFSELQGEYRSLLTTIMVRSLDGVVTEAERYMRNVERYRAAAGGFNVPLPLLMALHMREASGSFNGNLCNGDPLTGPTTHVPAGRPPLGAPPNDRFPVSWEYAARDAIKYDRLDSHETPWSLAYACYKAEAYNGFGPRAHGIHTGYLWAGTNHYAKGKYVRDGVWDAGHEDRQLGVVPMILAIGAIRPDLRFGPDEEWEGSGGFTPKPLPPPISVGANEATVKLIQVALNELWVAGTPLVVDGSFGKRTRAAVKSFEIANGFEPIDGLLDPEVIAAISTAAAKIKPGRP